MTTALLTMFLREPEQVEYLYTQKSYQVALIRCADGKTRYCDVTLLTTLSGEPLEQTYQPVEPNDYVICNDSFSNHYDERCSSCYLGHSHNFDKHFQSLLWNALQEHFGHHWTWKVEQKHEIWQWEKQWWYEHVPFKYNERRDRQTPR